jgi:ABC-type glycerol-3-phosphate transport system substrate-binding protein
VSAQINEDPGFYYLNYMEIDGNDNLYLGNQTSVFLYNPSGQYHGIIETGTVFDAMKTGKDGKVYIHITENYKPHNLVTIDYEAQKLGKVYQNVPELFTLSGFVTGSQNDFLISDGRSLYAYDKKTQSSKKILNWTDSDLLSYSNAKYWALEDGRIALINDLSEGTDINIEFVILTKTSISNMPGKEVLVAASILETSSYQELALRFNKSSDKYRIIFKTYVPDDVQWSRTTIPDAVEAMKKDIASNNPPDILVLDGDVLDITTLGNQGVLTDLNQFLSTDTELRTEDIIESILRANTVNGQLVAMTDSFTSWTLIGKSSIVGDTAGWTYSDFNALMDQYPDKCIVGETKMSFLSYCLSYGIDYWIDEKAGTSHFNDESFKDLLKLCNRFPTEYDPEEYLNEPGDGFIEQRYLLELVPVHDVSSYLIQEIRANEPVTFIGYPTPDGSPGNSIEPSSVYTIPMGSAHKEGAWAFIKFVLLNSDFHSQRSIPVLKSGLETMFTNATTPEYELDADGNPILDDRGNRIEQSKYGSAFGNSHIVHHLYAVTEEELAGVRSFIDSVVMPTRTGEVYNIIKEEAEAYFVGQKTVDEVVDIIQRRVQVYVSENH